MRRIDAHLHLWRLARGDYGWLTPDLAPLYRDVEFAEAQTHLDRHEIAQAILVQAAPTEAETAFLRTIAEFSPRIAGIVGWVDFGADDAAARIHASKRAGKLVGLRPMLQDIAETEWLLRPEHDAAFRAMLAEGLVFDALALERHLPALITLARRYPTLPIVIDHAAKPKARAGLTAEWRQSMRILAEFPQVSCKLSGLVTEIGPDWRIEEIEPVFADLIAWFAADRLIWGSDWPVLTLAGRYETWFAATERLIAGLSLADQQAILGGNAARIYALDPA